MLAKVTSCALIGLDSALVDVEVDMALGLPSVTMVGILPTMILPYRSF